MLKALVSDLGGPVYTFSEVRPNAKGHCVLTTKRHIKDMREMTQDE